MSNIKIDGPKDSPMQLILAHGAGAGINTPFMEKIASGIAEHGFRVIRFEFPYMEQMRILGKRRAPNSSRVLLETYQDRIRSFSGKIVIGGKSMGGRIASMIADQENVCGCICYGYPFHPPGKPEKLRTSHLKEIRTPTLILQGERDPFGKRDEISTYQLSDKIMVEFLPDGEHSFKPRKSSGHSLEENIELAITESVTFMKSF